MDSKVDFIKFKDMETVATVTREYDSPEKARIRWAKDNDGFTVSFIDADGAENDLKFFPIDGNNVGAALTVAVMWARNFMFGDDGIVN